MANENQSQESLDEIALLREQCRISDEGWQFHNKRANDLMDECNRLRDQVKALERERDELKHVIEHFDATALDVHLQTEALEKKCAAMRDKAIDDYLNP